MDGDKAWPLGSHFGLTVQFNWNSLSLGEHNVGVVDKGHTTDKLEHDEIGDREQDKCMPLEMFVRFFWQRQTHLLFFNIENFPWGRIRRRRDYALCSVDFSWPSNVITSGKLFFKMTRPPIQRTFVSFSHLLGMQQSFTMKSPASEEKSLMCTVSVSEPTENKTLVKENWVWYQEGWFWEPIDNGHTKYRYSSFTSPSIRILLIIAFLLAPILPYVPTYIWLVRDPPFSSSFWRANNGE